MSPLNTKADYERLGDIVEKSLKMTEDRDIQPLNVPPVLPVKAMSIREAALAESEEIPIEQAIGRVCASVKVPCPPAVPIAASGEIIDENCVKIFKSYGISSVIVVK
jgi:arginine/lysine/ornithine decarboxylase